MRVPPLLVLADGEREIFVQHGVDHVDEGDVRQDGLEQVGAQVRDRPDQEAEIRAAISDRLLPRAADRNNANP